MLKLKRWVLGIVRKATLHEYANTLNSKHYLGLGARGGDHRIAPSRAHDDIDACAPRELLDALQKGAAVTTDPAY